MCFLLVLVAVAYFYLHSRNDSVVAEKNEVALKQDKKEEINYYDLLGLYTGIFPINGEDRTITMQLQADEDKGENFDFIMCAFQTEETFIVSRDLYLSTYVDGVATMDFADLPYVILGDTICESAQIDFTRKDIPVTFHTENGNIIAVFKKKDSYDETTVREERTQFTGNIKEEDLKAWEGTYTSKEGEELKANLNEEDYRLEFFTMLPGEQAQEIEAIAYYNEISSASFTMDFYSMDIPWDENSFPYGKIEVSVSDQTIECDYYWSGEQRKMDGSNITYEHIGSRIYTR